jgi:hypothetical protein
MIKKRTRQSTRRQAKKLEIAPIPVAILKALGRDLDQFLQEQRQQAALELINQAAASLNAETHGKLAQLRDSDGNSSQAALIYDLAECSAAKSETPSGPSTTAPDAAASTISGKCGAQS